MTVGVQAIYSQESDKGQKGVRNHDDGHMDREQRRQQDGSEVSYLGIAHGEGSNEQEQGRYHRAEGFKYGHA